MIMQSPYTLSPAIMQAYGSYLNHVIGCPRCSRGGPCQKGARKRHIWRAARDSAGSAPLAHPSNSRRDNGGL